LTRQEARPRRGIARRLQKQRDRSVTKFQKVLSTLALLCRPSRTKFSPLDCFQRAARETSGRRGVGGGTKGQGGRCSCLQMRATQAIRKTSLEFVLNACWKNQLGSLSSSHGRSNKRTEEEEEGNAGSGRCTERARLSRARV